MYGWEVLFVQEANILVDTADGLGEMEGYNGHAFESLGVEMKATMASEIKRRRAS